MAVPSDYAFNNGRYWALDPARQLAPHVIRRYRDWRRYIRDAGRSTTALNGLRYYHGWNRLYESAAALSLKGETREYLRVVVNEVRANVQRVLAMLGSRTPRMEPVAASASPGAREETIVARDVLQHVRRAHQTESLHTEVRKLAFLMGEAYRFTTWDGTKGRITAADTGPDGAPVPAAHEGDFSNSVCSLLDVARDPTNHSWDAVPWVVVRSWENKHVLAAGRPENEAAQIRGLGTSTGLREEMDEDLVGLNLLTLSAYSGDTIPVYNFYHVDNPAMPGGRAFSCLSDGLWLGEPTALPYKGLPVKRLSPDPIFGTTLGDTSVFDLLGLSDAINILWSTALTNLARWGVGAVAMNKAAGVSMDALGNGSSALEYTSVPGAPNGGAPFPLQPPSSPPELGAVVKAFEEAMVRGIGLNDTATGALPFAGMPASLVAQLIEQAHQYQDSFYGAIVRFESDCATHELDCLKQFAKDSRVYEVLGDSQQWLAKEFSADSLTSVSRVAFEPVPPISNSLAGKQMLLDTMTAQAQAGGPISFPGIVDFYNTGRLPPELTAVENLNLSIARKQEQLRAAKYLTGPDGMPLPATGLDGMPVVDPATGQPKPLLDPESLPIIVVGQKVWLFIEPFLSILDERHDSPAVAEAVLAAVRECYMKWMETPPEILVLLGAPQAPIPQVPPGAAAPPGPPPAGESAPPPPPPGNPPPPAVPNGDNLNG